MKLFKIYASLLIYKFPLIRKRNKKNEVKKTRIDTTFLFSSYVVVINNGRCYKKVIRYINDTYRRSTSSYHYFGTWKKYGIKYLILFANMKIYHVKLCYFIFSFSFFIFVSFIFNLL